MGLNPVDMLEDVFYLQRWVGYFLKVTRYLLLAPKNISLQLATYYLENKVTIIILHIMLLFQQFSNNVSYSYWIEENLANEQQYT